MTLLNKTSQARKEALAYCRRCLAVMVCCVLAFGLTVPAAPRAKAVVADSIGILGISSLAGIGAGFASHPVEGSLGQFIVTGSGVKIKSGTVFDDLGGTTYFDARAQELGYDLITYLVNQTGEVGEWAANLVTTFQSKGGVASGDTIEIPAEVQAMVKQWAINNFDFVDGVCTYQDAYLNKAGKYFVLSDVDTAQLDATSSFRYYNCTLRNIGSLASFHVADFSESYEIKDYVTDDIYCVSRYVLTAPTTESGKWSGSVGQRWYLPGFANDTDVSAGIGVSFSAKESKADVIADAEKYATEIDAYGVLFRSASTHRLYCGVYRPYAGIVRAGARNFCNDSVLTDLKTVESTITKTPTLDETPTAPITVTIPQLPAVDVNGYTVPVAEELTPGDLVQNPAMPTTAPGTGITAQDIAGAIGQAVPGAIAEALPITGAIAGDQVVGEIAENPDGLGAVFISKFPFCIPWDIVKAIQLLAAPPVTPRWELDFMQPIAGRVGGFQGSTKLVLDFSEYPIVGVATRWVSIVLFVYALASGTKRFLWTA